MEHRLITGGFEYLPFARNCITKLKKLGLSYASQTYVIDGATINVRIANGQEFIRIDGGALTLQMDSGVVDLGNMGYDTPLRYLAGKLFATTYYAHYTMGFTKVSGDWLTNPNTASTGQFAGKLTTALKGAIHADGADADSFSPNEVDLPTDPVTTEPNPTDDTLLAKKVLALLCPASMFTGRCRMWVQAMYGRPTYSGNEPNSAHLYLGSDTGRPWLKIDSAKKDDTGNYTEIGITTDCGVFLDPATGDHWFIDINERRGVAMPLVASSRGEAFRKILKAHLTGEKPLTLQDAEHLEAFILSDCRPDPTKQHTFTFVPTPVVWSLGYGWHWNWSGTRANFVHTELFSQGGENYALRSTHYQLSVMFSEGHFSAVSAVVRGPNDWSLVPSQWSVLEPDWSAGTASKLQPPRTIMMAGSADFYAYYNRDELVTCSVVVEEHSDTGDNFVDMSEDWTGPYSGSLGAQYGYTVGMRDGHYTSRTAAYGNYYVATFSCGGSASGPCYYSRSWQEQTYSISNKAMVTYPTAILFDYGYIASDNNIPSGYPPYDYTTVHGTPDVGYPPTVEYDFKAHIKNVSFYSYAHILVPFNDAEAITSRIESHQYALYPSANSGRYSTGGLQVLWRPKIFVGSTYTGARGEYLQHVGYGMQQGGQVPTVVIPDAAETLPGEDATLFSDSKLFAAGNAIDAVIPDRYDYSVIAETNVAVNYSVVSGVQESEDAVVISKSIDVKRGISHDCMNPAIVGWA